MNRLRTSICVLFALAAFSGPCLAQGEHKTSEALARLIIDTNGAADLLGFLKGLQGLGDVDMNRRQIDRAVRLVGTTSSRAMPELIYPIKSIRIRGDRVEMERKEADLLFIEGGRVELDTHVSYRVVRGKKGTLIKSPKGISVSKQWGKLYRLKQILYTRRNGVPVAEVKAGVGLFTKTVSVPLPSTRPFYEGGRPEVRSRLGLVTIISGGEPSYGSRGPAVLALQRKLNVFLRSKGKRPIAEDGVFGSDTAVAQQWYRQRGSWPEDFPPN